LSLCGCSAPDRFVQRVAHNARTGGSHLNLSTVLIVSYHFYPSNEIGARRVTALARYLADSGVRVVVVSAFDDRSIQPGSELLPGIFAVPVKRPTRALLNALVALKQRSRPPIALQSGETSASRARAVLVSLKGRARDFYFRALYFVDEYKKWAWRAARVARRAGKVYGAKVILASGPPHSALLAGAYAARRLRIPYVADLRDPWSDYLAWTSTRTVELAFLRRLERQVLRSAAAITSTGATVAARLVERDVDLRSKVHVVRNGYDGPVKRGVQGTHGRLVILFAGELYVGRDPFPFLEALEWLLSQSDVDPSRVQVTFMGRVDSYAGTSLTRWIEDKRCAGVVRILPPQAPEVVAAAAEDSTVLLNLAQGQPLSVPAKTYEHLASGREILLVCEDDCETARLVSGIKGVNQVDAVNFQAFTNTLRSLYTRHVVAQQLTSPSELDVVGFSRDAANRTFFEVLRSVTQQ